MKMASKRPLNMLPGTKFEGEVEHPSRDEVLKVASPVIPFNVLKDEEEVKVEAFNPDDDELAGMTREEMLDELGKTGVEVEQVSARVVEDGITGEKTSKRIIEGDDEGINALQDINPEQIKKQLSQIAKQNIMMIMPGGLNDEDAEAVIAELEEKVIGVTKEQIKAMTTDEVKEFIGEKVYAGIKKFNQQPGAIAKHFLTDLKDSIVEIQAMMNTMEEMQLTMDFFSKNGIGDIKADIEKDLKDGGEAYPTELHRYVAYLKKYIEKLKSYDATKNNEFVAGEISVSEEKIVAITEALTFSRILKKTASMKQKIHIDFKHADTIDRAIWDFIGRLHNDQTIMITFPVPKNDKDSTDTRRLTVIWVLFLEMVGMQQKFPQLQTLSHTDYADMAEIVFGKKSIKDQDGIIDERMAALEGFAVDNGITPADFEDSKRMSIAFSYILARTFKPTRLNDTYTKYVLSYTMNILSQSLNPGYRELTHQLFNDVRAVLMS
jgi:hypothetical protein